MKKKIWLILAIVFCIITITIVLYFGLIKKNKGNDDDNNNKEDINITFKSNTKLELGSKVKISDLIENINGKLINDNYLDTTSLKEDKIEVEYYDKSNKKNKAILSYSVIDSTPPVIMLNSSYTVQVGLTKKLTDIIFCADNYDKSPKRYIEGEYDLNTIGEYKLKYVAIDSSNNKSQVDFTLKVVDKMPTNNSTSSFNEIYNIHKNDNTEIGIDVSKWQGNINWNKVKNAGATFAMIRMGYQSGYNGESFIDPYFKKNIEGATKAGLKVGVYYFSYATSVEEAVSQANWIVSQIKDYKLDLPVVFDWENWSTFNGLNLSIMDINKVSNSFLETITKNGYTPMLYGSKNYLERVWNYDGTTWLAHYTTKTTYEGDYLMWQLCSNGRIDGINGNVDINIMYK